MKLSVVYRVLLGVSLAWGLAARAVEAEGGDSAARRAVAELGSNDPAAREKAVKTLIGMGAEARRAVFEATQSEDPELRSRSSELLLKLPWYRADDSPEVRRLLEGYGNQDVEKRREIVDSLSKLAQHGHDALLRLIVEEPSDDVKWSIVSVVRLSFRDEVLSGFRKLELEPDNAPLLAAAGHAWLPVDVDKGAKLLRRAMAIDLERPANDGGEVEAAFDRLQNLALLAGHFDEVAALLRERARRGDTNEDGEPTAAVLDLFAAHAKYGPLAGFEKDLQTYRDHLSDPRVMFAIGKVYERCGQRGLAQAIYRSAYAADLVSIDDRFAQGDYLMRQGWLDLAQAEISTIFDLSADHSTEHLRQDLPVTPEIDNANAHFRLSQVAAAREDDFDAAEHMRQALELHEHARGQLRGATAQTLRQDIEWHYLRAARTKGDSVEIGKRLDALAGVVVNNPDIANDVVPMLREAGRADEAKTMFEQTYETIQAGWNHRADHPMPKNNLAWLCARCGERKEAALKMAMEATKSMPDNAAFVDTLAEAHYQLGDYDEAARLEAKVVGARPTDHFLREQLKRFQDAAKKQAK